MINEEEEKMVSQEFLSKLTVKNDKKIVLLIMDGLGGVQDEVSGKTELETADCPNLDALAKEGICGLSDPISPGITPGSGPAHLSLFGYDPLRYEIGRGLLDSLGIDFEFTQQDLASRGNFATLDKEGIITDRRAGRIATEKNYQICEELFSDLKIDNVKIFVKPVKEHRLSVIFRGEGLSDKISDVDPQKEGLKPLSAKALNDSAQRAADIVNKFLKMANEKLTKFFPANTILLRGFSRMVDLPSFKEIYKLNAAAIAGYPMYRGLAGLLGMDVLPVTKTIEEQFKLLEKEFENYDFFFIHIKQTDSSGEDGDMPRKVKIIEEVDRSISLLRKLSPDVVVITGDHSTPARLKSHSWHPVPLLIYSPHCRFDTVENFTETECIKGGLGRISAGEIMALALANAGKLIKYGA